MLSKKNPAPSEGPTTDADRNAQEAENKEFSFGQTVAQGTVSTENVFWRAMKLIQPRNWPMFGRNDESKEYRYNLKWSNPENAEQLQKKVAEILSADDSKLLHEAYKDNPDLRKIALQEASKWLAHIFPYTLVNVWEPIRELGRKESDLTLIMTSCPAA
eukprot:g13599.t1